MMVVSDFLNFSNNKERIMLLLCNAYPNLFRRFKLQVTPQRIQGFFLKLITETVEYREKNNIKRNDFLSMLIQLKNNGKLDGDEREVGKISFNDLTAQSCKLRLEKG
jgi:cytochrome P450 family 6